VAAAAKCQQQLAYKLRIDVFDSIMRQDKVFFEMHDAGRIQGLLKNGAFLSFMPCVFFLLTDRFILSQMSRKCHAIFSSFRSILFATRDVLSRTLIASAS